MEVVLMAAVFVIALVLSVLDARSGGRGMAVIEALALIIVAIYVISFWMTQWGL